MEKGHHGLDAVLLIAPGRPTSGVTRWPPTLLNAHACVFRVPQGQILWHAGRVLVKNSLRELKAAAVEVTPKRRLLPLVRDVKRPKAQLKPLPPSMPSVARPVLPLPERVELQHPHKEPVKEETVKLLDERENE